LEYEYRQFPSRRDNSKLTQRQKRTRVRSDTNINNTAMNNSQTTPSEPSAFQKRRRVLSLEELGGDFFPENFMPGNDFIRQATNLYLQSQQPSQLSNSSNSSNSTQSSPTSSPQRRTYSPVSGISPQQERHSLFSDSPSVPRNVMTYQNPIMPCDFDLFDQNLNFYVSNPLPTKYYGAITSIGNVDSVLLCDSELFDPLAHIFDDDSMTSSDDLDGWLQ